MKVGVLVNDFGSINIDAELVVGVENDVISLANGCVCCSIRDDLSEAVIQVMERPERPSTRILLGSEGGGRADRESPLTFADDPSLIDQVRLDSIICVIDAEQVFAAPERMDLKIWQVATADMVVLNKIDLVGPEQIEEDRGMARRASPSIRVARGRGCDVPLEVLLGVRRFRPGGLEPIEPPIPRDADPGCDYLQGHTCPDHRFESWSFEADRPLSLDALRHTAGKLPAGIYRARES